MNKKGSVLVGILLLLSGLMMVSIALSSAVLSSSIKIQKQYKSLRALTIAEAGLNKGLWKVNTDTNTTYGGGANGTLESDLTGGQYRVEISDCPAPATNCKYIKSTGYVPSAAKPEATRVVRVKIFRNTSTSNVSFKYGVQGDRFGVYINNNGKINGSVFSQGPITMGNNSQIVGNATSYGANFLLSMITGSGKIFGNAYAKTVLGVNVTGTTTRNYPPDQEMPVPSASLNTTLDEWETEATNGSVHTGSLTSSGVGNKVGPIKIDGDWTISNGAEVEVGGTIWVTGDIVIENNAKLYLAPGYGNSSGIIIADHKTNRLDSNHGTITVKQGATISGTDKNNPKTPSYIMLVSTETPVNPLDWLLQFFVHAITIQQGAVGGVFYAPFGSLHLLNNAQARAIAAGGILIEPNAIVDYDGGLANSSFAGGPAGPWTITEWLILD